MIETTTQLPTKEYEVKVKGVVFNIQPIPEDIRNMIAEAEKLGAEVRPMPDDEPTSIFVCFKKEVEPTRELSGEVVGIDMRLSMHLLGNFHNKNRKSAENFLSDLKASVDSNLPTNSSSRSVELVQVINTYEY